LGFVSSDFVFLAVGFALAARLTFSCFAKKK